MDIRRLEAFAKVYELGSFSKAGQELLLSQPTISAHVISLEQELGVQLFDRLGRTILPTQAGEILYRHARQIFSSLDQAKSETQLLLQRVAGDLVVGASTIPAAYLLPGPVSTFVRLHPDVRMQVRGGDSQQILAAVLGGEIAMGVVGAVSDDAELLFERFACDQLLIVAAPELAATVQQSATASGALPLECLADWPWLMREPGSGTRKAFETAIQSAGLDIRRLRVSVQAQNPETLLQCIVQGVGLCAISSIAAADLLRNGAVVALNVQGVRIERTFYTVRHAKRHVFPVLKFFLEHLHTETLHGEDAQHVS